MLKKEMSFLISYLSIVEQWSNERQVSGSSYSQLFEVTMRPNAIPASARQTVTWRHFGKSQRIRSTYSKNSVKKRTSRVQLVPESTQKSNILLARTGSKPNKWRGENLIRPLRAHCVTSEGGVEFSAQNRKWKAKMSMFGENVSSSASGLVWFLLCR